ncbi:MAG: hypothetical protein RL547_2058 [Actinomycetota bacterium]
MAEDLFSLTTGSRWMILVVTLGLVSVVGLTVRIWSIERSHRRIRSVLEKRVFLRTKELERAYEMTEHVVNAVKEAIVVVDPNGDAVLVNPAARGMLDIDSVSDDSRQICRVFNERFPDLHEFMREHVQGASGKSSVTIRADVSGRRRVLEVMGTPLDGPEEGHVYVVRDITDALSLLEMKSRFVSIVSHEIRTPLTSLSGSLDLLDAGVLGALPDRAADLVSIARSSTDRLVRLVNDVLDLDRLESQRLTLSPTWVSTDDLFVETLRTMQPFSTKHGVRLLAESENDRLYADYDRIIQVLLNLVQNAIKFAPSSSTIVVSAHRRHDDIEFSVEDEGRGIPPGELESIFEPFTQIETTDDRRDSGTGLGLAICRGIVQRHGGRIWAENRVPIGTRFVFTSPLARQETNP